MSKPKQEVTITRAKGRPMLTWVGKKPLVRATAYPAQAIEQFGAPVSEGALDEFDWSDWPQRYPHGGLLFHGDNKDVLAHLLANGCPALSALALSRLAAPACSAAESRSSSRPGP